MHCVCAICCVTVCVCAVLCPLPPPALAPRIKQFMVQALALLGGLRHAACSEYLPDVCTEVALLACIDALGMETPGGLWLVAMCACGVLMCKGFGQGQ